MSPRRHDAGRAPSQVDVARLAGVSTQTVSRVISGGENVRPETTERVMRAVDELGYRLHAAAASLASGRSRILGVLVVSTNRYSTASISVGIQRVAAQHGYTVITAAVPDHASIEAIAQGFDRLERQGAEAIVLGLPVALDHPQIKQRTARLPSAVNLHSDASPDVDQSVIARLAVEHLLDLGHRTVWHISGEDDWQEAAVRRDTWEQVLTERGITSPPVIPGDWTSESGYRAGRTLAAIPDATAVFVSSDEMAFGVLRALHEAGRRVPNDVSVVSVDDIDLAAYASPALTTVRQPFEQVGANAALGLIAQIEGWDHHSLDAAEPVTPQLIVRGSTAAPNFG